MLHSLKAYCLQTITKTLLVLKKQALIIALGFTSALTYLSLVNLGKMPNMGVSFSDKIYHFIAYALMTLVWFNYLSTLKNLNKKKQILLAVVISVVFGMVIELLQGALTATREADFNDIIANNLGVLVATLFLWFMPVKDVKKY